MRHRGTHVPNFSVLQGMLFAHCLLPIQGEAPVQQPIIDGGNALIFSGELWHHGDQRSDTNYLFHVLSYSPELASSIRELDGMFALVFYSERLGSVYFASDIFGEMPLYFTHSGRNLLVASEIKQLIAVGASYKEVHSALLGTLYVFDPQSGDLISTPYYTWTFQNDQTVLATEAISQMIRSSVAEKYATIDLQRSGLLLSGGLDSTILAYELSQLGLRDTFTVVADEHARDFQAAQSICQILGLNFTPIVVQQLNPDCAIAVAEVCNRSIVEEMTCHIALSNVLRDREIRVVFSGCGADEIFVGYQHLLRYRTRETRRILQEEFVCGYHKMDLRAFNKVYMLNAIEIRNPFLSLAIAEYAASLDVDSLLIGRRRQMKLALRLAYSSILGELANQPKLIARETMGAKERFQQLCGDDPFVYRHRWRAIFDDPIRILELIEEAKTLH